jgi:hypothetical protein
LFASAAVDNDLSDEIALHKRQWIILFCVPAGVVVLALCVMVYYKAEVSSSGPSLSLLFPSSRARGGRGVACSLRACACVTMQSIWCNDDAAYDKWRASSDYQTKRAEVAR